MDQCTHEVRAEYWRNIVHVNHEYWLIFWPPFPAARFTDWLFLTCSGRSPATDPTMEAVSQ